jgi:hypothetical protein
MKIQWHDKAVAELEDAALYYGDIDEVLGERFATAAEVAVAELKARPVQPRKFEGEARKVRLKRFPYAVIYWLEKDTLHLVSVMDLHREPGYWKHRL